MALPVESPTAQKQADFAVAATAVTVHSDRTSAAKKKPRFCGARHLEQKTEEQARVVACIFGDKTQDGQALFLQIRTCSFDEATAVLELELANGDRYRVDHPHYAQRIYAAIDPGGRLSAEQLQWLEPMKVTITGRERLRGILAQLRREISTQGGKHE